MLVRSRARSLAGTLDLLCPLNDSADGAARGDVYNVDDGRLSRGATSSMAATLHAALERALACVLESVLSAPWPRC